MNNPFLSKKHRFGPFWIAVAAFSLNGCIFSSSTFKAFEPPATTTSVSVALDSIVTTSPDVRVELYEPYLDSGLGASGLTIWQEADRVRVREQSGRVVEYHWIREKFGRWNEQREYLYNLYQLRVNFNALVGLFEDTTGLSTTAALYARAREHDRFTRYYDSANADEIERSIGTTEEPKVLGFLAHINDAGDTAYLKMVAPESPAYRAGLRRGMAILAINDSAVSGDSAAVRLVRFLGADTTGPIVFTMRGPNGVFSASMVREKVSFPTVVADSIGGVGYINIGSFTRVTLPKNSTATEFVTALKETRKFPVTVLDLRGNPGGDLNITLNMCEQVVSSGTFFKIVERRQGKNGAPLRYETSFQAHAGEADEGRQFILLADSNSASASELFIAALRSRKNTPFVGTRTYGKGLGQVAGRTPGRGYSIVTYARVQTAEGVDYNGTGLLPTQPSTAKSDAMLAEAVALAGASSLAKGTGSARYTAEVQARAGVLDWNRRQMQRPGVTDLVFPTSD